jgi:tRNA-splicing ligase RtcB
MQYEHNNVRNWASILDEKTRLQAETLARSPVVCAPVALMPDAHLGAGATVGSVIATKDAVIPAAVGVDIGCGMIAVETNLCFSDLPEDMSPLVNEFGRSIPAGVGRQHSKAQAVSDAWHQENPPPHQLSDRLMAAALQQMGTLGSGNHFLEVCLDFTPAKKVWLVVHSGSRGVGNQLALQHIRAAQKYCHEAGVKLEDRDLAHLRTDTEEGDAYIQDMQWAQRYAFKNREVMMDAALYQLFRYVSKTTGVAGHEIRRINCHHNFTQLEEHPGIGVVWLTRKGAIKAGLGDLGVVPGSMGARSYITSGLGNPLSYLSSAHGAGRQMSRGQAKREFTVESLYTLMQGCCWNDDNAQGLLDEHPDAYKPIDQVMEDQKDLTTPIVQLTQIVNFKGV